MAIFIQADNGSGDMFQMDATTSVSYSLSGRPSQYAVQSGTNSADHYTQTPDIITFNGFVSDFKYVSREGAIQTLEDFEKGLQRVKKSGIFFTVSFSDNLDRLNNCLFTSLRMDRSLQTGVRGLQISMTMQQVVVANQSSVVLLAVPAAEFKDTAQAGQAGTGSTKEVTPREQDMFERGAGGFLGDPNFRSDFLLPPTGT